MRQWAILVVVLYAVILAALFFPVLGAAFSVSPLEVFSDAVPRPWFQLVWQSWVVVMAACQAGLLVVPVRLVERRPITRRHLIWPILVGVLSLAGLAVAMGLAVWDLVRNSNAPDWWLIPGLAAVGVTWIVWGVIFGFYCGRHEPRTFLSRLVRLLIAGSILELLVAVPTHVYSRMKDHCCGGYATIWGIGLGISVMLFAFGPGVFMLFVRRWASVRARELGLTGRTTESGEGGRTEEPPRPPLP